MSRSSIHQFGGETEKEEVARLEAIEPRDRSDAERQRLEFLYNFLSGSYRKRKLMKSKKYKKSKKSKKSKRYKKITRRR